MRNAHRLVVKMAVLVCAKVNHLIGILVPDEIRHLKGFADFIQALITIPLINKVWDHLLGVIRLRQAKFQPCSFGDDGENIRHCWVLDTDRQ